jgi:hypothetical protein
MADVAHDAPGPSPKPGDIAPQQASRPDAANRDKLRVFISYSRDDLYFADQLNDALNAYGFECVIDRHGISGGEDWKRRLGNLISEADTAVFVLSPTSARSEICDWEVEEATRLGKRILPVVCRPLEGVSPPPRLRDLNYIFFYEDPNVPDSGFGTGLKILVEALNTDFDWLRDHTRYLQRATEWDRGGRPANRLLSGDDIAEAKAWAARRPKSAPEPTALHLDFIRASEEEAEARSSAQRKQLAPDFDAFFSYNSRDTEAVAGLVARLKRDGLRIWIDVDELRPGDDWAPETRSAFARARTVAIFVGPHGIGPQQEAELAEALDRSRPGDGRFRLIPVLLPGVGNTILPPDLAKYFWVDFRDSLDNREAYRQLKDALLPRGAPVPPPPGRDIAEQDLRMLPELLFRLAARLRERPEMLQSLDATAFWAAVRKVQPSASTIDDLRSVNDQLRDEPAPGALWTAWMLNTRATELKALLLQHPDATAPA